MKGGTLRTEKQHAETIIFLSIYHPADSELQMTKKPQKLIRIYSDVVESAVRANPLENNFSKQNCREYFK